MNAAALLALQQIDSALDAVANRRARLPEAARRREAAAALDRVRTAQKETSAAIAACGREIEDAEQRGAALDSKKARLEAQLKTVIAPREAEALMNEIRGLDAEHGELDEAELGAMERQAAAEARLAQLASDESAATAALEASEADLAIASAALDEEESSLQQQRPAAVAALQATELAAYERGRSQHSGVAVAVLDGHRCSGCHLDLSPAELDEVRAVPDGTVAECPQCARFLVR